MFRYVQRAKFAVASSSNGGRNAKINKNIGRKTDSDVASIYTDAQKSEITLIGPLYPLHNKAVIKNRHPSPGCIYENRRLCLVITQISHSICSQERTPVNKNEKFKG